MVAPVSAWPDNVQRVADFLREAGAEARIEEFPVGTGTAAEAAQAVGCEIADIVKTLVVVCDDRVLVALIPGDRRADLDKIARAAGASSARVARAGEVEQLTGFPPGGVAPFGLPAVERVLMERLLLVRGTLWTGAGTTRHVAAVPAGELMRLTKAVAADLVAEA
jgi:prolyl-tRNA editing enzyme YbaK/EbsC (Cys-tRNA(Pro) deacylase)